ncbi:AraC family transcriptional regulator [Mitsuaria sp. GD03876]|uniref:AraC family transcriptional regulator n=1 Tax=Mitsuaria sp. GD03876 TaxID=2975399 RepID=UPI0024498B05|nr:AraC family transcriptional regulator [Mitsuaria sp. GD03876]MDH0866690.1 AraC family transcriptional regulator [Mitsuaria sp. GD03876]
MTPWTYALDTTWRTLLSDLGVSSANVLRRAGLPDDLLRQPSARLPAADYYRLWSGIEAEMGDAPLPLRLCEAVRSESFSPVLFAALCSPDLSVAAQRIARFKPLIGPIRLQVDDTDGGVGLTFAWLDEPLRPPRSMVLMELLFCVALARMGTRAPVRPVAVTTTEPPSPAAPYEDFLGARIRRGPAHRVAFSAEDAHRPFLTSNDAMWRAFEPSLRERLADLQARAGTASRVRAVLLEGLPSGLPGIDDVARRLAVSKRTLQRRIEAEGTSYQKILNDTRLDLARHYLEKTALSHAEISFLLGFDETNSFYRAFKAWTGLTPDAARRQDDAGRGG